MLSWSIVPLSCFYCLQIELKFKLRDIVDKLKGYFSVISAPVSYTVDRAQESLENQAWIHFEGKFQL